jgi:excisionase family DNA binding protein
LGSVVNLLKPTDVARQLTVSRAWVYEATKDGRVPSVRIGGSDGPLRLVPEDLDRWMQEAREGLTPRASRRLPGSPGWVTREAPLRRLRPVAATNHEAPAETRRRSI